MSSREERIERALAARKENARMWGSSQPQTEAESAFKVGDDVRHKRYGEGVILDIAGVAEKAEVTIRFPDHGEKTFVLTAAPIEAI